MTYLVAMPYTPSRSCIVHVRNSGNLYAQDSTIYSLENDSWVLQGIESNTFYFTLNDILYSSEKDTFQGWNSIENVGLISKQANISIVSYDAFSSGSVLSGTGNSFDSLATYSVLSEIFGLLPVLLLVLVGYIGIRKGIASIRSLLSAA